MKRILLVLGSAWAVLSGCVAAYDPYYYDTAYYDPYAYTYDAAYAYTWYDPYGPYYAFQTQAGDLETAAAAIASRASSFYTPAECVTSTANGATVTTVYDNCTGQYGMRTISGTVVVTLTNPGGQLTFTGSSSDLNIDGRPYVLDLSAVATASGDQRTVNITSRSFSVDQFESRSGQSTVTWTQGSGCIVINGTSATTRGGLSSNTTITGLSRCQGQCPSAGTIAVETSSGTFTSTFDGTSNTTVTGPNGDERTFDLQCG